MENTREFLRTATNPKVLALLSVVVAISFVFRNSIQILVNRTVELGESEFGFVVVAAVVYFLAQKVTALNCLSWQFRWTGLAAILLISLLWIAAALVDVEFVQIVTLPMLILVSLYFLWGYAAVRIFWLPLMLLYCLPPFGSILVPGLQALTVLVVGLGLRILEIPSLIESTYILLPSGTLYVEEGCSGVNYFMTTIFVAIVIAISRYGGRPAPALTLLSVAVVLSLVLNWVRVLVISVVAYASGMQHALVRQHVWFGWVLYALAIGLLIFISIRVVPQPTAEIQRTAILKSEGKSPATVAGVMALVALFSSIVFLSEFLIAAKVARPELRQQLITDLPTGTRIVDTGHRDWLPTLEGADYSESFALDIADTAFWLDIAGYDNQSQDREVVSSENTLEVSGWVALDQTIAAVPLSRTLKVRKVQEVILVKGNDAKIVWKWFIVGGRPTANEVAAKVLQLRGIIFSGRNDAAIVTLSANCVSECGDEMLLMRKIANEN